MRRLLILCALGGLCAWISLGSDLTGIWTGQIPARNGEMQDIAFKFAQNGSTLTGKMYLDSDDFPIEGGKIDGDRVSFSVTSDFNGGMVKLVFTGTITGERIELTRDRESGASNRNPGDKRNFKQSFSLKRLI